LAVDFQFVVQHVVGPRANPQQIAASGVWAILVISGDVNNSFFFKTKIKTKTLAFFHDQNQANSFHAASRCVNVLMSLTD